MCTTLHSYMQVMHWVAFMLCSKLLKLTLLYQSLQKALEVHLFKIFLKYILRIWASSPDQLKPEMVFDLWPLSNTVRSEWSINSGVYNNNKILAKHDFSTHYHQLYAWLLFEITTLCIVTLGTAPQKSPTWRTKPEPNQ